MVVLPASSTPPTSKTNQDLLQTIPKQEDHYPDPRTLPSPPPSPELKSQLTLSELTADKYVSTTARVVFLRTVERQDALGSKLIFSCILEDSTFKVPFVSHRISFPLIRNCVYRFRSAYVHEFQDKSVLLIITENTKIEPRNVDDYREFVWTPKIESITRPVRNTTLQGVISTVHRNSGLVKRCNNCKSLIYDSCPNKCNDGWGWDLRVSCRLYDDSGSIKMVLTKDIASNVLQKNLSELILNVTAPNSAHINSANNLFQSSISTLKIPENIDIIEAVTDNPLSYRSSKQLIVTDGRNLVYFPVDLELNHLKLQSCDHKVSEVNKRKLKSSDPEDKKIMRRLIEKALDICIRNLTGKRMMQGIFLIEDPISLYRCEKARLYLGFSLRVTIKDPDNNVDDADRVSACSESPSGAKAVIETTPQAYVRESVLDYVNFRRQRGASANAVVKGLTTYRNKVVVAPSGSYGSVVDVIIRKAGSQIVSETDGRTLVEFWKQVYDIDISPDEIPLLRVKMMNSENTLTYPPSMCFFGKDTLLIPAGVQKFIEDKKATLKARIDDVFKKIVQQQFLKIGETKLEFDEKSNTRSPNIEEAIQSQLLEEIKQKLFGRNATALGSLMFVHDELWFFPYQLRLT
jgi:hypothetical protein